MFVQKYYFFLKKSLYQVFILFTVLFLVTLHFHENQRKQRINRPNSRKKIIKREVESCRLEELEPWDLKVKSFFKIEPAFNNCIEHEPLTSIDQARNLLFVNQSVNLTFYNGNISSCQVAIIYRNTNINDNYHVGKYEYFKDFVFINDEIVKARCYSMNKLIIYEYVHTFLKLKIKNERNIKNSFNVMILVLDSVSLSSMRRALPKSLKYLSSFENFFLFEKHHVTGENTFQNLIPMLTNLNSEKVLNTSKMFISLKKRNISIEPPFDQVPFIWKNFSQKGYVTYFSEEWKESTFYNYKFGFKQQPTDFYLRPYWLALYDSLSYPPTNLNSNPKPCYYNKLLHTLSFDWLRSFEKFHSDLESSHRTVPRFGLVKVNEMSHDYLDRLFWIDNDLHQLLFDLFTEKFLKNTLFIIMGDHGNRFHDIRQTFVGKMEEKLPMFGMLVPKKLLDENREFKSNLVQNVKSNTLILRVVSFVKTDRNGIFLFGNIKILRI